MERVQRYRAATRVLHWTHALAFLVLFFTGLVLFIPPLTAVIPGVWTRLIHRAAAAIFVAAPIFYLFFNLQGALKSIRLAFTWGTEDLEWFEAAPRFYFLSERVSMPPQGFLNGGQKLWWFMTLVFGLMFGVSGFVLWALRGITSSVNLQIAVFVHDSAFIVMGGWLFVHVYLSVFHPMMRESWTAMTRGTVSGAYARSHHEKWYSDKGRTQPEEKKIREVTGMGV